MTVEMPDWLDGFQSGIFLPNKSAYTASNFCVAGLTFYVKRSSL